MVVLTLLAISGMTTASIELQMAGNEQYQDRAFQAADAGIERAIQAGVYDRTTTVGAYTASGDPNVPPTPQRGSGVAGCIRTIADDGSIADTADCYEYFMRFDDLAGATPVPDGSSAETGLQAYHFIVDAYGTSGRGATSHHTQSFYIVGPAAPEGPNPPEPAPTCAMDPGSCTTAVVTPPVRTYWRQAGVG